MGIDQEDEGPKGRGVCNSLAIPIEGFKHGGGGVGLRLRGDSIALADFFLFGFFFFFGC